jgi:hypothetical protein
LVRNLTEGQLKGTLELSRVKGTVFTAAFPKMIE